MSANYLHGVETIETENGGQVITSSKTSVIGIVGTAPIQDVSKANQTVNKPVLINNEQDAAKYFGDLKDGYTIPRALKSIFAQGSGTCIVINVFDPGDSETPDPSTVTSADIIGSIGADGIRKGAQAFYDCNSLFGYSPRILISPAFSTQKSVVSDLDSIAGKLKAKVLSDIPIGTKFQDVIEGRGTNGSIDINTSSDRVILCYPHLKVYDPVKDSDVLAPYSSFLAGVIAATDNKKGYWYSPSNKEIKGVTGAEFALSASINDPACEVNMLNEVGIVTIFSAYGTGIRTWGNRSASYPTDTSTKNFISVGRVSDVIVDSIDNAMLPFIDLPMTQGTLDAIVETVNGFMRVLIARGAIIDGKCWINPADNDIAQLAAGNVVFTYDFMPPIPLERITFKAVRNVNYLKNLIGGDE